MLDPADPRGFQPEEILIAPITDPAWTPLFLGRSCCGRRRRAQSHAAIVSRELGMPAVVSVTGASQTIPDGVWARVDGNTGEVHISDEPIRR